MVALDVLADEAGGARGEVKVKGLLKVKREGFIYGLSSDVELTGGKTEKTQLFVKTKVDEGGTLRPYDAKAEAKATQVTEKKKREGKPRKKAAKDEAAGEPEKVIVVLSQDGNEMRTTTATVIDWEGDRSAAHADYGEGTVRVEADKIKPFHSEPASVA